MEREPRKKKPDNSISIKTDVRFEAQTEKRGSGSKIAS